MLTMSVRNAISNDRISYSVTSVISLLFEGKPAPPVAIRIPRGIESFKLAENGGLFFVRKIHE